jgi:two-component system sensor histidine kinase CpxA
MQSLFAKIFTWYLLSALVIMAAVSVTILIIRNDLDASRFRALSPETLSNYPLQLIRALEENRTQDAKRIEADRRSQAMPRYIFNENGKELLGRFVPAPVNQLFEKTRSSREIEILSLPLSTYIGKYLTGDGGKGYIVVYALRARPLRPFTRLGAGWAFIALLLALIVILCWWLTRQLTSPLLAVGSALSRLAEGDLGARIESNRLLSGGAELVRLARNFNFMAERMENLVTGQRRWIADAAHEFGSPLTRLGLALGIAQRKAPPNILPYLERIEDETDRLHGIMHQLLTLAQMDALPQPEATELIDLPDLISGIVNDCDFEAQARSRRVKLDLSEDCSVLGARELLRSAIENVVRNGVRYTASSSEVSVTLRVNRDSCKALIAIRDHGPGVPEEALKPMFEPFYRVRDGSEPDSGGTGLGLAITSRAAAAHRGTVVAANAVGGGLEVRIELPLARQVYQTTAGGFEK